MANGTGSGNRFRPRVIGKNATVALGSKLAASSLFTFLDIENNPLRSISIIDNGLDRSSGYWEYDGKRLTSGRWFTFSAAQLSKLKFVAGLTLGLDRLQVRVQDTDGRTHLWSDAASVTVRTIAPNRQIPTVSVSDVRTLSNERVRLSNVISGSDPDGFSIVKYKVRYTGQGTLTYDGRRVASGTWFTVTAANLSRLVLEAPSLGSGVRLGQISAQSFDGRYWSNADIGNVVFQANATAPTVRAYGRKLGRGATLTADSLISVGDADGNTIKTVRFFDTGVAADGGYFTVNGVRQTARVWFTVDYSQLSKVVYHAADTFDQEVFRVQVNDGLRWSAIDSADMMTVVKPVIRVLSPGNTGVVVLDEFEELAGADLIQQADAGPRLSTYQVIDLNGAAGSGYFALDGARLAADRVHSLNAGEFSRLTYVGGSGDDRYQDEFMVRVANGTYWSDWVTGSVHTEPRMTASLKQLGTWSAVEGRGLELTYSFMSRVPDYYADDAPEREGFQSMNGLMRNAVRTALERWSNVSGVTFREVSDLVGGVMRFGSADLGDESIFGWAYGPDGVLSPNRLAGDVWLNWNTFLVDTADDMRVNQDEGSMNFLTSIHEIGHALGLSHPFDQDVRLPALTDSRIYTVMSYAGPTSGLEPSTPQLYDIAAIQEMYGSNSTFNAGNTTYRFAANTPTVQTIYDANGVDTLDFSNQAINVTADLRPGMFTTFAGQDQALTIAYGTRIENLYGGDGADDLTGNIVANRIMGNRGNDFIRGLGGSDWTSGGAGNDTYLVGIADGDDTIDEQLGGGRDVLRLDLQGIDVTNLSERTFASTITARRIGQDLHVSIWKTNGPSLASVRIRNMGREEGRIEALEIYNGGRKVGRTIDLDSIYVQSDDRYARFQVSEFSSSVGQIALRV